MTEVDIKKHMCHSSRANLSLTHTRTHSVYLETRSHSAAVCTTLASLAVTYGHTPPACPAAVAHRYNIYVNTASTSASLYVGFECSILHCTLAAAQCIVISPVCEWVGLLPWNCMHRSSPNWVCR